MTAASPAHAGTDAVTTTAAYSAGGGTLSQNGLLPWCDRLGGRGAGGGLCAGAG
ncbi:hypothetical protein CU044_3816 [Streptomyces sp. L-9-10]|nr:hypothetical protein CU044_3816 [Streptomyces sp. L-9-10]